MNRTIKKSIISRLLIKLKGVRESNDFRIPRLRKILIVRQHNQFGDLLTSTPLFRALKENYPNAEINIIVSKENYYAITKNKFISEYFIFDKKKLFLLRYWLELINFLRRRYDIVLVPVTVAISKTSCILAALSDAKIKIGPSLLDGKANQLGELFHYGIELDWRKNPDSHVSEFGQEIIKPFGIFTEDLRANINFDARDKAEAEKFLSESGYKKSEKLVGFHIGAGKPPNRWGVENFARLIDKISKECDIFIYFTGSNADNEQLNAIDKLLTRQKSFFINRTIPVLAALISLSDLFVTNDTGVMHVAGTTDTPQISLFGPTNPNNWAPIGENKFYIKKTDDISFIPVDEVFSKCISQLQ